MRLFNDWYRRRARALGLELADLGAIGRSSTLEVELPAALGQVRISAGGSAADPLRIGAHSYMRSGEIFGAGSIGRFCSIGTAVVLGLDSQAHPIDWASTSVELCQDYRSLPGPTRIGHDVWIGQGAVVYAGVRIGHGAVIGSGALVTKDVEPYALVVGVPARPLRQRFEPALCAALLASRWWDKPVSALRGLDYRDPARFAAQASTLPDAEYRVLRIAGRRVVRVR